MDKECKSNLESLLQGVAKEFNLKIHSLDILTNQNPIIIKIIIILVIKNTIVLYSININSTIIIN